MMFWSSIVTFFPPNATFPSVLSTTPPLIVVSPDALTLTSPLAEIPAWLETVWFPFSSYPNVDSMLMSPPAFTSTPPFSLLMFPPIMSMFSLASSFTSPLAEIPPFIPADELFVIPFSDLISIFPPEDMFPFEFTTSVASILISPPAWTDDPTPAPVSAAAIFNLVSFPKYTCGTKTICPCTSISTYQTISSSKLLICSGVRGFPTSSPNLSFTFRALSNITLIWSVETSPEYPNPSLIVLLISCCS